MLLKLRKHVCLFAYVTLQNKRVSDETIFRTHKSKKDSSSTAMVYGGLGINTIWSGLK